MTIRHVKSRSLHEWACYFVKTVKYSIYSTICATVCTQWLPSWGTLPSGWYFRWGDLLRLCMHACAPKIRCLQLLLLMSAEELCWQINNLIAISKSLYCKLNALNCKSSPSLLLLPAVDNNRSGVWNGTLGAVDFLQEPEDTPRFIRHTVVWPTQVLVVPDVPQRLLLQKTNKQKKSIYIRNWILQNVLYYVLIWICITYFNIVQNEDHGFGPYFLLLLDFRFSLY